MYSGACARLLFIVARLLFLVARLLFLMSRLAETTVMFLTPRLVEVEIFTAVSINRL